MQPSKTRKPHKKSRNGCLPCKARHVKCDEQRPQCANCIKQEMTCEYASKKSRASSTKSPLPSSTLTPSSIESPTVCAETPNPMPTTSSDVKLNLPQLRLLHHYILVTAKSLAYDSNAETVYTTSLVQVAFDNAYLMHSILALAAVHLSRLEKESESLRSEYLYLADIHYDAALAEFRAAVRNIDITNWKPVLMFAGAIFPYSCIASITSSTDTHHAFQNFVSNLALTRRVRPMVTGYFDEMMSSELASMVPDDVKGVDWQNTNAPADTELVQLRKFSELMHQLYPPDIIDAYASAIHVLDVSFAVAARSSRPPSDALLKIWMHFISDRYIELLSEKQPGSLIILAHYAVLLNRSEQYWYLEGVAESILNFASAFVPSEWSSWLDWPKSEIQRSLMTTTPG